MGMADSQMRRRRGLGLGERGDDGREGRVDRRENAGESMREPVDTGGGKGEGGDV
jgi:hypothetical protein